MQSLVDFIDGLGLLPYLMTLSFPDSLNDHVARRLIRVVSAQTGEPLGDDVEEVDILLRTLHQSEFVVETGDGTWQFVDEIRRHYLEKLQSNPSLFVKAYSAAVAGSGLTEEQRSFLQNIAPIHLHAREEGKYGCLVQILMPMQGPVSARPESLEHVRFFPLNKRRMILGRDPKCDIELADPDISREHAELSVTRNRVYVRDLDSTNGTVVNWTTSIQQRQLHRFDTLHLGSVTLHFLTGRIADAWSELVARFGKYDALTNCLQRSDLLNALEIEIARSVRSGNDVAILKVIWINADEVSAKVPRLAQDFLVGIARRIRSIVRRYDLIAREENAFIVILPEATHEEASQIKKRITRDLGVDLRGFVGSSELKLLFGISSLLHDRYQLDPATRIPESEMRAWATKLLQAAEARALQDAYKSGMIRLSLVR